VNQNPDGFLGAPGGGRKNENPGTDKKNEISRGYSQRIRNLSKMDDFEKSHRRNGFAKKSPARRRRVKIFTKPPNRSI
jgi:hypothetical protein